MAKQRPGVLIIDDEESMLSLMQRVLSGRYHVVVAPDGDAALRVLGDTSCPVHAVLMDLNMPGMNGHVLMNELRGRHPGLPVVVMSGMPRVVAQPLLRGHQPEAYLQKPVRLSSLVDTLNSLLGVALLADVS